MTSSGRKSRRPRAARSSSPSTVMTSAMEVGPETGRTDSADQDRICPPAGTSDGETEEESGRRGPGKEEETAEPLHLHPFILPLQPPPLSLLPLLSVTTVLPDPLLPGADPLTRARCTPHLSPITGTMTQTHPRLIPENAKVLELRLTPQVNEWVGEDELLVGVGGVLLWSSRKLQSATEAPENLISVPVQLHRRHSRAVTSLHHRGDRSEEGAQTDLGQDWLLPPPLLTPPHSQRQQQGPIGRPLLPPSGQWSVNRTLWPAGLAPGPQTWAANRHPWRSLQLEEILPPQAA